MEIIHCNENSLYQIFNETNLVILYGKNGNKLRCTICDTKLFYLQRGRMFLILITILFLTTKNYFFFKSE